VTTAGTKEISEFTMLATEAARGVGALEAAHTSDPAFDAAMVLFKTIVKIHFPVPNRLMANDEPAEQEHFAQIPERQPVAQTAKSHKADDFARKGGPVQDAVTALVELPTAVPATKPPVALSRNLTTLRNRRRATADTIHLEIRTAPAATCPTKFAADRQNTAWRRA
jgi:hypothetical protein